ncbi:glycosyltransferase family 2 protein [Ectothiorhodospira variabilis]|uniref:glycosyltransferase family 2 protein n=1 Tax=Ectothiorhodospira variabilis TaxID=505694 RepID=UPI001EFBD8B1|nr:glycosyltransferase [Ectothiorhodospira variabilis]MCG5497792.1 glycosyltransferase [Ectothiorhodospira variabilis]
MVNHDESPTPKVSVVCAWYNRADYIRDTVDSLLAQDLGDFEVVIVNDGSTDPRVAQVLDSYDDPRLRVIHQKNTGFVGAIRRAISEAKAPIIATQGAGDISFAERLRLQFEYLHRNPTCVGVGCLREQCTIDQDGKVGEVVITGIPREGITRDDFLLSNSFTHGEVMFRRSEYEQVGGYREFFRFAQDRDLWLRLSELGTFSLIPEVLYQRRTFEADGVSASAKKVLTQQTLSVFARQCATHRDRWGSDPVDMYGMQAGLFRDKDRRLANLYAKMSAKYLYYGHLNSASILARKSIDESITTKGVLVLGLTAISSVSKSFQQLAKWVIGRIGFKDRRAFEPIVSEKRVGWLRDRHS